MRGNATQALEAYNRKRDFTATSEPRGRKARGAGNRFVVQKHAARRLHYDFRLELDGVLKSWAVAKGPSLTPGEKRLAVHVEDHPLDYGNFEGTIPAGQYGAGSVMLWDQGIWKPDGDPRKGYAKGHLAFTLEGQKLHGRWNLVRMRAREGERGDNWLLIKSDDEAARSPNDADILDEEPLSVATGRSIDEIGVDKKSRQWRSNKLPSIPAKTATGVKTPRQRVAEPLAEAPSPARSSPSPTKAKRSMAPFKFSPPPGARKAGLPDFLEPQLATLTAKPPATGDWLHEIKLDGYRIQAICKNGRARLYTRKGLDWTDRFPRIASAVAALNAPGLLVDGEIVFETAEGVSDFSGLQNALSEGDASGLRYYAFDLLHLGAHDLRRVPLVERKRVLEEALARGDPDVLRFSQHFETGGDKILEHVCRLGGEGVVSKRRAGLYRAGRSGDWLKSKCVGRQEFVIVGLVPSATSRQAIGSLVLGYWRDKKLVHAGRVGTGFSHKTAAELFALLDRERIDRIPVAGPLSSLEKRDVRWVRPERVAEVEFRGWTGAGQLRQASFKGLREDKSPSEIVREEPVRSRAPAPAPAQIPGADAIKLTHPDRMLWPDVGVTKQALADYYAGVWSYIRPFVTGRPLALVRCPNGFTHSCFFQKHAWEGMPSVVRRIKDPGDPEPIVAIEDFAGLRATVQASVLEIHPWGARVEDLERPDMLIFDLDPGEAVEWPEIVAAAREARQRLQDKGLESFVKTTGGKGLHVVAPLNPRAASARATSAGATSAGATWARAKGFCKEIAESMAHDSPQLYVAKMSKQARVRRIYVDYLRNGRGATAVAAYSTRARAGCPVSTPIAWEELDAISSAARFTVANLPKRLAGLRKDPWADFFSVDQDLPEGR